MSKRVFYGYLAFLAILILVSLSHMASLGGYLFAFAVVMPLMVGLAAMGVEFSGQNSDGILALIFWGASAICALTAFWQFYLAADQSDKGNQSQARGRAAFGFTLLTIPTVVYLWVDAVPWL